MIQSKIYRTTTFNIATTVTRVVGITSLVILMGMLTSGCGRGSALSKGAADKNGPGAGEKSMTSAPQPTCLNWISLDNAPANWKKIELKDLIAEGSSNQYLLHYAAANRIVVNSDLKVSSLSVTTQIIARNDGDDQIVQQVLCKDLQDPKENMLVLNAPDVFQNKDGTETVERLIEFKNINSKDPAAKEVYSAKKVPQTNAITILQLDQNIRKETAKAKGEYKVQAYQISDDLIEIRYSISTSDTTANTTVNFNVALTYKVQPISAP